MAFLRKTVEKNSDNYAAVYEKSGDEDDRLRKEYLYRNIEFKRGHEVVLQFTNLNWV